MSKYKFDAGQPTLEDMVIAAFQLGKSREQIVEEFKCSLKRVDKILRIESGQT
jgi:uncharacterized protein (DUF433 family)